MVPFTAVGQPGRMIFAAPTQEQAVEVFWEDLQALIPPALVQSISLEKKRIRLHTNWDIDVRGLDKPQRVEGRPLDRIFVDEFDDVKEHAWSAHILPAMATEHREGSAWLLGTPEGRGPLWRMIQAINRGEYPSAFATTWTSEGVIPDERLDFYRRTLDERTFNQEFMASFELVTGRAYYEFDPVDSLLQPGEAEYDPDATLLIGLDFNREPGIAVVAQDLPYRGSRTGIDPTPTVVLGEVHIPRGSTTPAVCRKLIADWGEHRGPWRIYGDASGGNKTAQGIGGSDWDLVRDNLFPATKGPASLDVRRANPRVNARIVAMNSRLRSADGVRHMLIHPKARFTLQDLEGVQLLKGAAGELDKSDLALTHLTDALGYLVERRYDLPGVAPSSGSVSRSAA